MKRAALAALLLSPAVARAENLQLLNTTVLEYRGNNKNGDPTDDNFGLGINKLYLNGASNDFTVRSEIDAVGFTNYPDAILPGTNSAYQTEARLERLSVTHLHAGYGLTLGDFHQQLGRGVVLSLRRLDELGQDQALRGGSFGWSGDSLMLVGFAGVTNVSNLDGVTLKHLPDPDDSVFGAAAILHLGRTDLGVHGIYLQPKETLLPGVTDRTEVAGAYLETPVGQMLTVYAEGAIEQYSLGGTSYPGHAGYLSTDWDLSAFSLLLEGLVLDQFRVQGSNDPVLKHPIDYNLPPTLERIDQEVFENHDVRAVRAKVTRSLLEGNLVLYASGMFRSYGPTVQPYNAAHGYAGFELTYDEGRSRWYASGGYRQELRGFHEVPKNPNDRLSKFFKTIKHAETDWVQALGGPYALHLSVTHETRTLEGYANVYYRGTTILGLDKGGLGSLSAEVGYDTQISTRRTVFLAGIVTWEANDWLFLKAVVGTERGGIKCIGGVCRDFPPFAGVHFEATIRHDVL